MDATRFGFLLVHAGALPRLAMQQMLDEITASLGEEAPLDAESQAAFETAAREQLERATDRLEAHPELLPAMEIDVFNAGAGLSDEERRRLRAEADAALELELAEEQAMAGSDELDGPLDLAAFLAAAYARPVPAAHAAAALARVDAARLDALLGRLPAALPPLWAPLDAAGLAQWLALFRAEDADLEAVVDTIVRSAGPA